MFTTYKGKRSRNLYSPSALEPFRLSRSRMDNFLQCKRCFYIDRRLGLDKPPGFPFNLNSAVDHLLKKEFDLHRKAATRHPLMHSYGLDVVPFDHPMMDVWRDNFKGVEFFHKETNLIITGAIDDLWISSEGSIIIVDYKATSKEGEVTIDAPWQVSYHRQMEIYQWLFKMNGFQVSEVGYFVYCNGNKDAAAFDGKLEFDVKILPYKGNTTWIDAVLRDVKTCLDGKLPDYIDTCDYCVYRRHARELESV